MPTWPTGVELATLTFGKGITADGNQTGARLTVKPRFNGSKTVVWTADGTPVYGFELKALADSGGYQVVKVPVVDQSGWVDDGQNLFTRWYYEVTETPIYGDIEGEPRTKAWQPLSGVGNYDFDRIPDGSAGLPVVTPQPAGAAGPAGGFLSGSYPNPGVNQTALSNAMAARTPIYWQPNTYYAIGSQVIAPDGSTVQAIANFTSGATYNAANWTVVVASAASTAATYLTQIVESSGAYPARPAGLANGRAHYVGSGLPSDWITGDRWTVTPRTPKQVIWDTDWYTDVDDVVAARMLAYYERLGYVDVLASIVDTNAANGAVSLDAFFRSENRSMQIGQIDYTRSDLSAGGLYQANLIANWPHYGSDSSDFPEAVTVYRTMLANATQPVEIIAVGYLNALAALRQSPADSISPLTGAQLIAAKVSKLWVMGGQYPSGSENNFNRSTMAKAAAQDVVNNWPTTIPIVFLGFEVGYTVSVGAHLAAQAPINDALGKALADHGSASGRPAWDPMMTMLACVGDAAALGYTLVRGTNVVNADGSNTFTASSTGPHYYVVKAKSDAAFVADINPLLVKGRQPEPYSGVLVKCSDGVARPAEFRNRLVGRIVPQVTGNTAIVALPTVLARMKATDYTGADGSAVASIPANAGTGPSWAQATGSRQPTYRATIGGRACLQFAGAQALTAAASITTKTSMTVLARVRWDTLPTSNQTVVSVDTGTAPNRYLHLKGATGSIVQAVDFISGSTGSVDSSGAALVAGQWHLIAMRMRPSQIEALIDGVSNGATSQSTPAAGSTTPNIGVSVASSLGEPVTGYIADIKICDGYASDNQLVTLSADM